MTDSERHRLSLIIATLGPSTDNEKELITMLMAGIARQWTDGVDIARVLPVSYTHLTLPTNA